MAPRASWRPVLGEESPPPPPNWLLPLKSITQRSSTFYADNDLPQSAQPPKMYPDPPPPQKRKPTGSPGHLLRGLNSSVGEVFLPVVHDWVINGLGMSSHVCVTGHIQYPLPLIEKSRASCSGGRIPPTFIIITGLNKLYGCMFSP